jgi:hypothetical protein
MRNTISIVDDASPPTAVPFVAMTETTESANTPTVVGAKEEEKKYVESVGKLIRDLAHSSAKVNAALDALLKLDVNTDRLVSSP